MHRPLLTVSLSILIATALSGCVQRTVTITSEPSGALIYLNDEEVGRTPLTVPFTFYGKYDVRIEAEGHHPLWTRKEATPPWWDHVGPDLFAEVIPHGKAEQRWHFVLTAAPKPKDVDEQVLLDHAHQLRATIPND